MSRTSGMTYSRWERLHFKVLGYWPQRVVDRRLSSTTFDPSNVNAIMREVYESAGHPVPAEYLDDRPQSDVEAWTALRKKSCPACHGARSVQVGGPDEFGNIDYDDCQVCT